MKENNFKLCSNPKIYAVMCSLYRFSEFQELESPTILIDNEKHILQKHFSMLTAEEILYVSLNFENFLAERKIQITLEDAQLAENFASYIKNLN